jgi:TolB-like protein/AraC-like DNA-binding protein/Tfp pilus assembly protein PilF
MVTYEKTLVEKLNRLIEDNLDNPSFSIDTICQAIGISRSQLHRTIKEQTELSTTLYIRKRRLLQARHLLTTTYLRISEIGDAVGITNPQNFSTYFIEEFKVSPTEFRKLRAQSPTVDSLPLPKIISAAVPMPPPVPDNLVENPSIRPRVVSQREWIYVGFIAGMLLISSAGLYIWFQTQPANRPAQQVANSLAVLPFTNLGSVDSNPACEGIMDDIRTSISLIKTMKVISRASSDQYKDTKKTIWQIGDELQVTNVLKGSILKTADQIQIKVEIVSTREDIRVWGKKYNAPYKDIFQLTDQIVQDVAQQLNQPLSQRQAAKVDQIPTRNLHAYQEYIRGKHLMLNRTGEKLRAAITQFDHAIALDPGFADAYAFRASSYLILGDFGFMAIQPALNIAEKNALEAIRIDNENGTSYGVLANIYRIQNKWKQALITFQIALQHSPNDAQINFWYAIALRSVGRFDMAIQHDLKAVSLDPLYPAALFGLIGTCANAGRYDLARQAIKTGESLFSDNYMYYNSRAFYYVTVHDYPRASAEMHVSDSLSGSVKSLAPLRLYIRAKLGPKALIETELKNLHPTPENYVSLAAAYAGLREKENCLKYLQLAADQNLAPDYLKVTPLYAFLRNDPRFTRILHQNNLIDP